MKPGFDEDAQEDIPAVFSGKMGKSRWKDLTSAVFVKVRAVFRPLFSSKKTIMITLAGAILFMGLITGGLLFFSKSSEKDKNTQDATAGKKEKTEAALKQKGVFEDIVVLKPFERIHLKEGSSMKLISLNLSLELSDGRYRKEVTAMEDTIRQIITGQVEKMTWLELRNPEGKIMLKYDLLKRINSIFSEAMIRNIYFTNFLMQ